MRLLLALTCIATLWLVQVISQAADTIAIKLLTNRHTPLSDAEAEDASCRNALWQSD